MDGLKVIAGNVGDSRAVLSREGSALALTDDHKANRPDEIARIVNAGALVAQVARVVECLALTGKLCWVGLSVVFRCVMFYFRLAVRVMLMCDALECALLQCGCVRVRVLRCGLPLIWRMNASLQAGSSCTTVSWVALLCRAPSVILRSKRARTALKW